MNTVNSSADPPTTRAAWKNLMGVSVWRRRHAIGDNESPTTRSSARMARPKWHL